MAVLACAIGKPPARPAFGEALAARTSSLINENGLTQTSIVGQRSGGGRECRGPNRRLIDDTEHPIQFYRLYNSLIALGKGGPDCGARSSTCSTSSLDTADLPREPCHGADVSTPFRLRATTAARASTGVPTTHSGGNRPSPHRPGDQRPGDGDQSRTDQRTGGQPLAVLLDLRHRFGSVHVPDCDHASATSVPPTSWWMISAIALVLLVRDEYTITSVAMRSRGGVLAA